MVAQHAQLGSRRRVPEADRPVVTRRGDRAPIRREDQRRDVIPVAAPRPCRSRLRDIEDADLSELARVAASGDELSSIGAESQSADLIGQAAERRQDAPRRRVDQLDLAVPPKGEPRPVGAEGDGANPRSDRRRRPRRRLSASHRDQRAQGDDRPDPSRCVSVSSHFSD